MTDPTRTDRRTFLSLGVGALVLAAVPAGMRRRPALVRRRIPVMGTVAEVAIPTREEGWAQHAIDAAFSELRRVEATMSRFCADSDIGRVNVGTGLWIPVSYDTASVVEAARRWARISEGRFDPCLGRLSELWDVEARATPPHPDELDGLVSRDGWKLVDVDRGGSRPRVRLGTHRAAVDLGGIAKGYAVDVAAQALRGFGVADALVNAGGDLVSLGVDVDGEPWRIGIRAPHDPRGVVATIRSSDEAVATSGDYLRFFEHHGRRYHHLLDPSTGRPHEGPTRSITVRARRCLDADAASTALFGCGESASGEIVAAAPSGTRIIHHITEVTT